MKFIGEKKVKEKEKRVKINFKKKKQNERQKERECNHVILSCEIITWDIKRKGKMKKKMRFFQEKT